MKIAVATLKSVSPYGQSKHYVVPKLEKESAADYEKRTWRERMHETKDGHVFIPPMAFKNALTECAQFLGEKIPGKGQATWTKHFLAGVLVSDPVVLPVLKKDVPGEWLFLPSDGVTGSGKRVNKCMPRIDEWQADVRFYILDETIGEQAFIHHIEEAGKFIGIGFFRPRRGGYWGRFEVVKVKWDAK